MPGIAPFILGNLSLHATIVARTQPLGYSRQPQSPVSDAAGWRIASTGTLVSVLEFLVRIRMGWDMNGNENGAAVEQSELREIMRQHCEFLDRTSWELPRLAALGDQITPSELGVHPASRLEQSAVGGGPAGDQTPYVNRDIEYELANAIAAGGLVLLKGHSMAGKSRTGYEAMLRLGDDLRLLVPKKRESLDELVKHGFRPRDTIIWLNELQDYLGPGGLDVDLLHALIGQGPRGVVLLATMRASAYQRWASGSEQGGLTAERVLLERANVVELNRFWSDSESARAAATGDPRLSQALLHRHEYGVAEFLGAGPTLLARWKDAQDPSSATEIRVGGVAISAAIDCRRAGLARPASKDLLHMLYAGYLKRLSPALLGTDVFEAGLSWASEPVWQSTAACIDAVGDNVYFASDYLLDKVQTDPKSPPVGDAVWQAVLTEIEPEDAWNVGKEAYWASRPTYAEQAYRTGLRSADRPTVGRCALGLADLAYLVDDFPGAQQWRERATHPESLPSDPGHRANLGQLLVQSAAEEWYLRAANAGGDPASALVITREHALLAFDGQDYHHTVTRELRNNSADTIVRYPFRIAVVRYPDDPVKNEQQFRIYPMTVDGSRIQAWCDSEEHGRQSMDWIVEQDRESFKELWALFKNPGLEFPLLPGRSATVTYRYTASSRHWGPWSKRKVRMPTGRLGVEFSFPAWMQPDVFGADVTVAKDESPMDIARRPEGNNVIFTWEVANPPVSAQYQFDWRLGNDPEHTTSRS